MLAGVGRRIRAVRALQRGYAMHPAVQAAIARFPDRGHAIEELSRIDDSFMSLCEDFAAAQAALVHWERSGSPVQTARCAEYRELVRDLAAEIAAELDRNT
ncbi:hypothetical protein [Microvirga lotononidis]|uniref:Uncharacterized protein n=1 Tax=Microvirga lotononidis TaxID=864069 RepID=I4YRF3_9HYPH|nr:hypothetical protein [Microvirga lotononidis]EIM26545.1 hypothetical protein MicloDRAFT_00030940 [Microvirga lotononidis]WQO31227.1 hypothetical protein U0023_33550 [Microvirga lotononidis]